MLHLFVELRGTSLKGASRLKQLSPSAAPTTQRLQNPSIKEYTLNLIRFPIIV